MRFLIRTYALATLGVLLSAPGGEAMARQEVEAPMYFRTINHEDGLEGLSVLSIARGPSGQMWIGTSTGLTRFDGVRTKTWTFARGDSISLPDSRIDHLQFDRSGNLWIATQNGLAVMRSGGETIETVPLDVEGRVVVNDVDELPDGNLLLSTWGSGLLHLDPSTGINSQIDFGLQNPGMIVRNVVMAGGGSAWISTYTDVFRLDLESGKLSDPVSEWNGSILAGGVTAFKLHHHDDAVWMATTNGVVRVFPASGHAERVPVGPDTGGWRTVRSLYSDDMGALWAGTGAGLARFSEESSTFVVAATHSSSPLSVAEGTIHAISADASGMLWIGTDESGLSITDLYAPPIRRIDAVLEPTSNMVRGHVWSATSGAENQIWVGSESGLGLYHASTGKFESVSVAGAEFLSVTALHRTTSGDLWLGILGRGLCRFNIAARTCRWGPQFPSTIYDILETSPTEMWIATFGALLRFNPATGEIDSHIPDPTDPRALPSQLISSVFEDGSGTIWVGSDGGLSRFDRLSNAFDHVLEDINVFQIRRRDTTTLWLVGNDIQSFDTDTGAVSPVEFPAHMRSVSLWHASVSDGSGQLWAFAGDELVAVDASGNVPLVIPDIGARHSFEFARTANAHLDDGTILMGMEDGFIHFNPRALQPDNRFPQPRISDIWIDGVRQSPSSDSTLFIPPNHRTIAVDLEAPYFASPAPPEFEIMLSGIDDSWRRLSGSQIMFTQLRAGEYDLNVRAVASNGRMSRHPLVLSFEVGTAWWMTGWALFFGGILFMALFASIIQWRLASMRRVNQRLDLMVTERTQQLQLAASELKLANEQKSRFFSNVSHELRTPLTLISGYLDELDEETGETRNAAVRRSIVRSKGLAERLETLVGQLLDVARADGRRLKLEPTTDELVSFVQRIVSHFSVLAHRRFINLTFETTISNYVCDFDGPKLDQAIANLIGNAIKFTSDYGAIWVYLDADNEGVSIRVADTGPGIAEAHLDRIFERFHQVEDELAREHQGLGIGLALTKEFIEIHGGTIDVASTVGEGTVFTTRLPLAAIDESFDVSTELIDFSNESGVTGKARILVVEDNEELQRHIVRSLQDLFDIQAAANGLEAWELIQENRPDLVLTDVMMPRMSGLELLSKIRLDEAYADLPVVLLTARADDDAQIEALEARADDFIGKPFNKRLLRARLLNLVQREREWHAGSTPLPVEAALPEFLQKVHTLLETHLADPDHGVKQMAEAMFTSDRTFQRRIKELTGESAAAYLRGARLDHAKNILESANVRSVTQAAQEVGFVNVSHFSTKFEERFGINPKDYML